MKFYLATGEAVTAEELVGAEVAVEWDDPACAWEGAADDFPTPVACRTRGRFLGVKEGAGGPSLGIASEDVGDVGDWRTGTAIPLAVVRSVVRLNPGDEMFTTRTAS